VLEPAPAVSSSRHSLRKSKVGGGECAGKHEVSVNTTQYQHGRRRSAGKNTVSDVEASSWWVEFITGLELPLLFGWWATIAPARM
jgi:hypothetical protein